jgi:hypothetical protein
MSDRKVAFIISHGQWHVPAHYETLANILETRGYKVVIPLLPSCRGRPFPANPVEEDSAVLRHATLNLIEEGYEVVGVGHSYGGIPITDALHGVSLKEREKQGLTGGVSQLIYVGGFFLDEGRTLEMDAPIEIAKFCHYENGEKVISPGYEMGEVMYPDLPVDERPQWVKLCRPTPQSPSFTKLKHFAYREIEPVFVFLELDAAYPYIAQKMTIEAFQAKGDNFKTETLPSGHFPSLSMPGRLSDLLVKYAE